MAENFSAEKNNKQGIICIQPFTAVSFFVNGDSWNCLVPYRPKYSIGNIKQKSIAEMWNSKTARWIRRKMYAGEWQDICNPTCDTIVDYVRSNKFIKYKELEKYKFEGIELLSPQLIEEIRTKKNYLRSPQLTFQYSTADGSIAADVDIDEYSGFPHWGEVLRNHFTRQRTNPYAIHQLLLAANLSRRGWDYPIEPGYELRPLT